VVKDILRAAKRNRHTVIFDDDPERLVDRMIVILDQIYK
jgi:hypothetical protein